MKDVSGWTVRLTPDLIDERTRSGAWRNLTLGDFARRMNEADPLRTIFIENGRHIPAGHLVAAATRLAHGLRAGGLMPGDVISFQLPNWHEAGVIYLAAALAGLVVNPIVPIFRDAEVEFMLEDSRSKALFIPAQFRGWDYVAMAERLAARLPALRQVVVLRGDPGEHMAWEAALRHTGRNATLPPVNPNAVKLVMYTSGTTGRPKAVLHSHNSIMAEVLEYPRYWVDEPGVVLMASPVSHITGCLWALELPWTAQVSVVLMETWDAELAVELALRHGVTVTSGATPFLDELLAAAKRLGQRLPDFRRFVCGGAQVPPELVSAANSWFTSCVVSRCFGATEVPSVTMGARSRDELHQAAHTDGIVTAEVRIRDVATGASLGHDQEGEVLARCPEQFLGYARPEDNEGAYDADGFFCTGDLGRLSTDGYLTITGRTKDLIIRGGENLSPVEIEQALLRHPLVRDVAVVAAPHWRLGETVACFVVPAPGTEVTQPELARHITACGLARQKIPEHVILERELPRSPSGKVLKGALRDKVRAILAQGDP